MINQNYPFSKKKLLMERLGYSWFEQTNQIHESTNKTIK